MAILDNRLAFVDEYGTPDLEVDKSGTSFFIVVAVLVNGPDLLLCRRRVEEVRRKHFQTGEMKSSNVAAKDSRRLRILDDLAKAPIRFFALSVNKAEVRKNGGLIYKQPFLKFMFGQLFNRLYRTIPSLQIIADQHGSAEFMHGFRSYVERNHKLDLFDTQTFAFGDSKEEPLIQAADMIAGTIGRVLDPLKHGSDTDALLRALDPMRVGIRDWPPRYGLSDRDPSTPESDLVVAEVALDQVTKFLAEGPGDGDSGIAQRVVLEYLLHEVQFGDRESYVPTGRLRDVLHQEASLQLSEYQIRLTVIAPLRDSGVLISSSQKGYKIPMSLDDIQDFLDRVSSQVEPMLHRVKIAREQTMLSAGTDILSGDRHLKLRSLVDALDKSGVTYSTDENP